MMMKLYWVLAAVLILSSCAGKFQPQTGGFGYSVFSSGEGRYRIEYFDGDPNSAQQHWNQAAKLACSGEYSIRYQGQQPIEAGSYLVPIAGTNQRFTSYTHIYEGEVVCNSKSQPSIAIDTSPWFFYGKQQEQIPVSETYLVKKLSVGYGFLAKAQKISASTSPTELINLMGPATKFSSLAGNSEWLFTDGYKKLTVLQIGSCITKVKLSGDPLSFLAFIQEKKQKEGAPERFDSYVAPDFYYLQLNKECK